MPKPGRGRAGTFGFEAKCSIFLTDHARLGASPGFFISMPYIDGMRRPTKKPENLEERIVNRITRKRGDVFLRADFSDLGDYDQVGRALRSLVRNGRLMKIGQGLYARARRSSLDNKLIPEKGLDTLKEALQRLGIETVPTRFERAYNSGRSEQVPTGRVVAIRGKRLRRQIGYDGVFLSFERAVQDRTQQRRNANRCPAAPMAPITAREALRLVWEAERYPIRGNEDWRSAAALTKEALARAATATASPDDPPELAGWLAELCSGQLTPGDGIMDGLYALFDPTDRTA
jgi:hypothetical protein